MSNEQQNDEREDEKKHLYSFTLVTYERDKKGNPIKRHEVVADEATTVGDFLERVQADNELRKHKQSRREQQPVVGGLRGGL